MKIIIFLLAYLSSLICFGGTKLIRSDQIFKGAVLIGVSSVGSTANSSSYLEIRGETKGFLQPRMTTTQRDSISTPVKGLSVYNTNTNVIDFYNGSSWVSGDYAPLTLTTNGDVLYYNSGYQRLAKGSDTQVLTLTSGLPAWETPSTGFADPMTTAGDLIYKNSGGTTTRLAAGIQGSFLSVGVSSTVQWVSNNVESTASGGTKAVSAKINGIGTVGILDQDGTWLSGINDGGTGDYELTITGSTFGASPNCVCVGTDNTVCQVETATDINGIDIRTRSTAGAYVDRIFYILCIGDRP